MLLVPEQNQRLKYMNLREPERLKIEALVWRTNNLEKITELLENDSNASFVQCLYFTPSTLVTMYRKALKLQSADEAPICGGNAACNRSLVETQRWKRSI